MKAFPEPSWWSQLPVLLLPVYRAHALIEGVAVTQGMDESRKVTVAKDRPSHCHIHTGDPRDLKKMVWTVPECQEPSAMRSHCIGQ